MLVFNFGVGIQYHDSFLDQKKNSFTALIKFEDILKIDLSEWFVYGLVNLQNKEDNEYFYCTFLQNSKKYIKKKESVDKSKYMVGFGNSVSLILAMIMNKCSKLSDYHKFKVKVKFGLKIGGLKSMKKIRALLY